tara:strand:+ start:614 stop:1069 length:456 start_codon:yes stop_codon:yes gene_type:complete
MRKLLSLIFILSFFTNCDKRNTDNYENEFYILKKENDSLKNIISEIDNKYVFDSISYKNNFDTDNTYGLNSTVKSKMVIVAYSTETQFIKYDSLVAGKKINPDTLDQNYGSYYFSTKLDKEKKFIQVEIETNNKYGKNRTVTLNDIIRAKN